MKRRLPGSVLLVAAVAGSAFVGARSGTFEEPVYSAVVGGWMPHAPATGRLSETWFCPGVPAAGSDGIDGSIVVLNRTAERLVGTALVMNERQESVRLDVAVDGWSATTIDLDATVPGAMVGAVVEIEGGGAVVEQRSSHPGGASVAPCANAPSSNWYLADGFTVDGSLDQLVLMNPYEQTVVVNIEFATREGRRRPNSYRGLTIPPKSIRLIDLGAPGAGAQSEPLLAVSVEASRGRLVVGRFQHFLGGGRLGTQATLASPSVRDQWWFVGGRSGDGVTEQYAIYNPTDDDVEVDPIFLGVPAVIQAEPIAVPAGEVRTFEPASLLDAAGRRVLPDGPYAVVFSTLAVQAVVVERASTVRVDGTVATTVVAGAPPRQDGHVATTWRIPAGPSAAVQGGLSVYNADNVPGTVSVFAVGRSGPVPVDGLQDLPIDPAGLITVDLVDPIVFDRGLIVSSTTRVFVERRVPTGRGSTSTATWALPDG